LLLTYSFNLMEEAIDGWKRASFSPLMGGARVELAADSFTHMPSKKRLR
ncbi:Os01g0222001, partial [Oryza sativa Japonica Group]